MELLPARLRGRAADALVVVLATEDSAKAELARLQGEIVGPAKHSHFAAIAAPLFFLASFSFVAVVLEVVEYSKTLAGAWLRVNWVDY